MTCAQARAMVLSVAAILTGCDAPRTPPSELPASRSAVKLPEDPFWATGVRGANAPNMMLNHWINSGEPRVLQTQLTAELADALANDTKEVVDLYEFSLTDEIRAKLRRLRRVLWLRLPIDVKPADLEWLGEMRQLRGVSLAETDMSGADFQRLAHLNDLQWLNLDWTRMAGRDFTTLPRLKSLQTLCLEGELVNDEYLSHLAEIRLPSLVSLWLYCTTVTDIGVDRICSVYELENLDLFLARRVTEQSVKPISRMRTLRELGIGGSGICRDYQMNDAVGRLKRLLPNTVVDYGD
jgi:hypothetical protein